MKTDLFDYELPEEFIAARPPEKRNGGRLLTVGRDQLQHGLVANFVEQLRPSDLLVLNETKVRKARLMVKRPPRADGQGGGKVELLFLHSLGADMWAALGRANRPLKPGAQLLADGVSLTVKGRDETGTLQVQVEGDLEAALQKFGEMPIPPYMARSGDEQDEERYQTVFAREVGSAAAPTAGLHLTEEMLVDAQAKGVQVARVLLHVGIGTFRPVMVDDLDQHPMHSEEIAISEETRAAVSETHKRGGRVIAIGTTVVRALESARDPDSPGDVIVGRRSTDLLIQPGYQFSVVDALLTNFHQPKSTLLALVSAFAGRDRVINAYQAALAEKYRFLSYGDAMWLPEFYERH